MESIEREQNIENPIVLAWGRFDNSTLLKSTNDIDGIYTYQGTNRIVRQIATGSYHTACITTTGETILCGSNDEGQISNEDQSLFEKPRVNESLGNHRVHAVSVGLYHTVCVSSTGAAISFGGNDLGQCGRTGTMAKGTPSKVDFRVSGSVPLVVKDVSCGDLFSLFLTTRGEVYSCGVGSCLGNTNEENSSVAQRIEALAGLNIVAVAAGSSHAFALSNTGELFSWGSNQHGQLGRSSNPHEQVPGPVPLPPNTGRVVGVSAGYSHTIIWTSTGQVLGCGNNKYGQLGVNAPRTAQFEVIPLGGVGDVCVMAACGLNHTLFLVASNSTAAGSSSSAPLGASDPLLGDSLRSVDVGGGGGGDSDVVNTRVLACGANNFGQVTKTSTAPLFRIPVEVNGLRSCWAVDRPMYVAAGGDQSFVIGSSSATHLTDPAVAMRKQFSTLASLSTRALDCKELLRLVTQAELDPRQLSSVLFTVCELFSSPALLAGSFTQSSDAVMQLDVEGLEEAYGALLHLGTAGVVRLVQALQAALADLARLTPLAPALALSLALAPGDDLSGSSSPSSAALLSTQCPTPSLSPSSSSSSSSFWSSSSVKGSMSEVASASASGPTAVPVPSIMRSLLILWQCPTNANPVLSTDFFRQLLKAVHAQPQSDRLRLKEWFARLPAHIFATRFLKPLQDHLAATLDLHQGSWPTAAAHDERLPLLCETLQWLHDVNHRRPLVPASAFHNSAVSDLANQVLLQDVLTWVRRRKQQTEGQAERDNGPRSKKIHKGDGAILLSDYAFLMSPEVKRRALLAEAELAQSIAQRQSMGLGNVFMVAGHGLVAMPTSPWFVLRVRRENLLGDALAHIAAAPAGDLMKPLKVVFEGEEGVDEGGVKREFFQLLTAQLFAPEYGMFVPSPDGRSLWINSACTWAMNEFEMVGALLGLAVYNGVLLDIHFPKLLYKKLLNEELNLDDLATFDPALHAGLKQLLEHEPAEEVEHVFCRSFEHEWVEFGERRSTALVPNGAEVAVTGTNRGEYVGRLLQWLLSDSVREPFERLRRGFVRVLDVASTQLCTSDDLELLMVGQPHLDFAELERHTEYVGETDWGPANPAVRGFWEAVHALELEDKQRLLLFVTGSKKAPIGGLKNLGMKIQRMGPHSNVSGCIVPLIPMHSFPCHVVGTS